jgi:hypothetical protein
VARQNFSHSKRQRELGKQQKRQEKLQRKAERKAAALEPPAEATAEPLPGDETETVSPIAGV